MRLVIASRKSDLARLQAYAVGEAITNKFPEVQVEYHFRESLGDKNLEDPLWKMPEKGVFTEDFTKGLEGGEFDAVVHSWKDLPTEERVNSEIIATLPRADMRDLLLVKKSAVSDTKTFQVLTSSPRRVYNLSQHLRALLPFEVEDILFEPVRGNIQTRVQKLHDGKMHALVVAKAAIDRLFASKNPEFAETQAALKKCFSRFYWMVLPLSLNPTAAAQGALAIEIKKGREDLRKIFQALNCPTTFEAVTEERDMLKGWGGGCHQKIGVSVLPRPYGKIIFAKGEQSNGKKIEIEDLQNSGVNLDGQGVDSERYQWFERQVLPVDENHVSVNAHWVSKSDAFPVAVKPDPQTNLVWVSGIKTWHSLARRGVWVNGSSESLGEREDMRLDALDILPRQWGKWTHEDGEDFANGQTLRTYRLVPKSSPPKLDESAQHFFWSSGSSFREALKHYPWLINKTHWSGPGHTHDIILNEIRTRGGNGGAHIALGNEQWQKTLKRT